MLSQLLVQLLFFLVTASLLPSTASAGAADWLFPANIPNATRLAFERQDTINASWTSSFVEPELTMFCANAEDTNNVYLNYFQSSVLVNGSCAILLNTVEDDDALCHLTMGETNETEETDETDGGSVDDSNSGFFHATKLSNRPATTISSPTELPAATTSQPSATAAPSHLSPGAKAGIGVGAALGPVLLLTAVLLLWTRARRRTPVPETEIQHDVIEMDGRIR